MRVEGALTPKGERSAEAIIDAALRCLARDGYAATSLQRVADEAELGKRTVIYYYGTREGLFDQVVRRVGGRLLDQLEQVTVGEEDPADIVSRGFERVWAAITTDRALLVAWFGLLAESVTNPALADTASYITTRFRGLIARLIDDALQRGRTLHLRRSSLEVLILAGVQGLVLEYLERGETPELSMAIEDFQAWLISVSTEPADADTEPA